MGIDMFSGFELDMVRGLYKLVKGEAGDYERDMHFASQDFAVGLG